MGDQIGIASPTSTVIWPALTYRDAPAAIRFLRRAFGFQERLVVPGDAEHTIAHAELRWPDGGGVMLGSHRADAVVADRPANGASIYVVTHEPDALYQRARAAGAAVVRGLRDDHDYDSRGFTVRDPEGVVWSFGTYAGTC